ncbi:MAG: hypothetical protein WBA76_01675 [Phormidesmis sp.]
MKPTLKRRFKSGGVSRAWKGRAGRVGAIALLGGMMLQGGGVSADELAPMTLTAGEAIAQGTTSGRDSLTQLAARDRRRKICLGYANADPDHILILIDDQPRLQVAVDSSGGDTTLLIQGPKGIDCNDNARRGDRDAAVIDSDWPAGKYRIWVGSFSQGEQLNYTLRISEPDSVDVNPLFVRPSQ